MSSPMTKTRSSRSISCAIASVMASIIVIVRGIPLSPLFLRPDVFGEFGWIGVRALLGEIDSFVDFLRDFLGDFRFGFVAEKLFVAKNFLEEHQRIALLPRFDFFLHAVFCRINFRVAVPTISLA